MFVLLVAAYCDSTSLQKLHLKSVFLSRILKNVDLDKCRNRSGRALKVIEVRRYDRLEVGYFLLPCREFSEISGF